MAKCEKHRSNGEPCNKNAIKGKTFCYTHGGASLKGMASPTFIHGRRSIYLPTRLMDSYTASLHDQRLTQLRDEISLVDARINDLLQRTDSGESGRLWKKLKYVHGEFSKARSAGKVDEMQERLGEMEALILAGVRDADSWVEVERMLDLRRKLSESERKRVMESQQVVTSERLLTFMSALMEILASEVKDKRALSRVSTKLMELTAIDGTATPIGSATT